MERTAAAITAVLELGGRVLYGDVDSVFFVPPTPRTGKSWLAYLGPGQLDQLRDMLTTWHGQMGVVGTLIPTGAADDDNLPDLAAPDWPDADQKGPEDAGPACLVCLDPVETDAVYTRPCDHFMHRECFKTLPRDVQWPCAHCTRVAAVIDFATNVVIDERWRCFIPQQLELV